MKYLILSDVHGCVPALEKALENFSKLGCGMIICLGDILYHGARNPLPEGYDNPKICGLLNPLSEKIIACRGNCDAEICQTVLKFPLMQDYAFVVDGGKKIFATHGHIYSPQGRMPETYDVFLYGHTHVSVLEKDKKTGRIICNPGSTTFPKGGSEAGFAVYEPNNEISLYNLDGRILKTVFDKD